MGEGTRGRGRGRRVAVVALGLAFALAAALPAGAASVGPGSSSPGPRSAHLVKAPVASAASQQRQACIPLFAMRHGARVERPRLLVPCCPVNNLPQVRGRYAPQAPPGCCLVNISPSFEPAPHGRGPAPRIPSPYSCSSLSAVLVTDAGGGAATYEVGDTLTATTSTPGYVFFYENGTPIPSCASVATTTAPSGAIVATCAWTPDAVGVPALTATLFPTNGLYTPSKSPPHDVTVSPAPSSVTLALSDSTTFVGLAIGATATVSTPGTVTFSLDGSRVPGCVGLPATTTATCSVAANAKGHHALSAALAPYSPDYSGSSATAHGIVVLTLQGLVIGPFAAGASVLSGPARAEVGALARLIVLDGYRRVTLIGEHTTDETSATATARVASVVTALDRDLSALGRGPIAVSGYVAARAGDVVVVHVGV